MTNNLSGKLVFNIFIWLYRDRERLSTFTGPNIYVLFSFFRNAKYVLLDQLVFTSHDLRIGVIHTVWL